MPFPIEVIICGQYIWIAIPVKKAARSGLRPLSVTLEYTDAMFLPGSTSIGQIDSPSEVVAATLQLSSNDGATWKEIRLEQVEPGHYRGVLPGSRLHAGTWVSLRATARDTTNSRVAQALIRAFPVR